MPPLVTWTSLLERSRPVPGTHQLPRNAFRGELERQSGGLTWCPSRGSARRGGAPGHAPGPPQQPSHQTLHHAPAPSATQHHRVALPGLQRCWAGDCMPASAMTSLPVACLGHPYPAQAGRLCLAARMPDDPESGTLDAGPSRAGGSPASRSWPVRSLSRLPSSSRACSLSFSAPWRLSASSCTAWLFLHCPVRERGPGGTSTGPQWQMHRRVTHVECGQWDRGMGSRARASIVVASNAGHLCRLKLVSLTGAGPSLGAHCMELSYSCCRRLMMASNCSRRGLSLSNSWRLAAAALSASLRALHASRWREHLGVGLSPPLLSMLGNRHQ